MSKKQRTDYRNDVEVAIPEGYTPFLWHAHYDDKANDVVQSRAGGRVERAHGYPHIGSYSNAAHSWGVAMLMLQLWPDEFPRLGAACLTHDVPEFITGDIMAPTGRYVPGLKDQMAVIERKVSYSMDLPSEHDLEPEDLERLKACDMLEFWLWSQEQLLLGNQFALEGLREVERIIEERGLPSPADALYAALRRRDNLLPRFAGVMKGLCE